MELTPRISGKCQLILIPGETRDLKLAGVEIRDAGALAVEFFAEGSVVPVPVEGFYPGQNSRGDTMLKRGDKLRFFLKGTKTLYGELTVREVERTAEEFYKVWFEESAGEDEEKRRLVAVDKDDNEYEVSSSWKDSRDSWGYILRPI